MIKSNKHLIGILLVLVLFIGLTKISFNISTSKEYNTKTKIISENPVSESFSKNINIDNYSFKTIKKNISKKDTNIVEIKAIIKLRYNEDTSIKFNEEFHQPMCAIYNSAINYSWTADVWKNGKYADFTNDNNIELNGNFEFNSSQTKDIAKTIILKKIREEVKKQVQKDIENLAKAI